MAENVMKWYRRRLHRCVCFVFFKEEMNKSKVEFNRVVEESGIDHTRNIIVLRSYTSLLSGSGLETFDGEIKGSNDNVGNNVVWIER